MMKRIVRIRNRSTATILLPLLLGTVALASQPEDLTLKGNQAGTVFRSLTVEGENRVQIRFKRPALGINIDPNAAPGLMLEDGLDILDRTLPDVVTPLLKSSATTASNIVLRPWLTAYTTGPVAQFTTVMEAVENWKLQVVDSRGQTAMVFAGQGNPPRQIAWDGMRLDGTPAPPGYTYSFVLEASDTAGNQRRFVGDGFVLPAYRRDDEAGPDLMVSGAQWVAGRERQSGPSALALEAASWINLRSEPGAPVRVIVTHRTVIEAAHLAELVADGLRPLVAGGAVRVVTELRVKAGAPPAGTLHLTSKPKTSLAGRGS